MAKERVLVAMSGGVDSSVAAALLHEAGHRVVGVTLHLWDAEGASQVGRCCAPEDRDDARRTCEVLGVPHYVIDERAAFRRHVVDPFVDDNLAGVTPSPCVHCNQQVKLGRLWQLARELGCEAVATGHYARIECDPSGRARLLRGADHHKDQSYFLYGLAPELLERLRFPLGQLDKAAARREGERLGVPNWGKPDSQELCFVPDGDVRGFIGGRAAPGRAGRGGAIVDEAGRELGRHGGIEGFTVGQRRGLGVTAATPRYVLRILPDTAEVVVGPATSLACRQLTTHSARWLGPVPPSGRASVRIRYRHRPAPAEIRATPDGFEACFDEPQQAVAPGQAAVAYDGDLVLGGGIIA